LLPDDDETSADRYRRKQVGGSNMAEAHPVTFDRVKASKKAIRISKSS